MQTIPLDDQRKKAFADAIGAMRAFRAAFGRDLNCAIIAELHAADALGLEIVTGSNVPGFDAVGPSGERYEIKYRAATTLNVEVNSFDFDQLVLVNLDDDFRVSGMWMLSADAAHPLFTRRDKFNRYQARQRDVKRAAVRIS